MFANVGEKIKKAAKVIFGLDVAGSAVLAWVAWDVLYWWDSFLITILVFAFLVVWSYVAALVLNGFGEMVENSTNLYNLDEWYAEQEKNMKEIKETLKKLSYK